MASTSSLSGSKAVQRRQSCDTVCSSNSSCYLHKRKPVHPLANSIRTYVARSNNNTITQRVLSARLLKLRSLQNQLNDANFHLTELQQENKALRNLQTRQDKALSRYEGANADLPRLLKAHEEETRVYNAKIKTLRKNLKEVTDQLKIKEDELASVREQHNNLVGLTKHKNLGERQALLGEVEELKEKLKTSDDKISLLNRKIQLESKNYKYKLNSEMVKSKQAQKELAHALAEIDRLTTLLEAKGKFISSTNRKRFANVHQRQSVSLIALTTDEKAVIKDVTRLKELPEETKTTADEGESKLSSTRTATSAEDDVDNHSEYSDVKLEPISNEKDAKVLFSSNIMVSPTENIKARLSANLTSKGIEIEEVRRNLEQLNMLESGAMEPTHTFSIIRQKSRPSSSKKLEKISSSVNDFDSFLQKSCNTKKQDEIEKHLGNACTQMKATVKECGDLVAGHMQDFQTAKSETEKLLESLRETDFLNSKLMHSTILNTQSFDIPEKDIDMVNQIWNDEHAFRKNTQCARENVKERENFIKSDTNGNVIKKEMEVAPEDKTKLLATLRAIDNGEDLDEIKYNSDISNRNTKLYKELFGDLN